MTHRSKPRTLAVAAVGVCVALLGVLREVTGSMDAEALVSSSRDREGGMRAGVVGVGGARDGVDRPTPAPPPARRRSLKVTAVGGLAAVRNKEVLVEEGVYGEGVGAGAVDGAEGVGGALRRKLGIRSEVWPCVPC